MTTTENKSNKTNKIIFWISTILIALFVIPGIFFLNSPLAMEGVQHVGVPLWLHYEVGIGAPLGALILLLPFFGKRIKEWAYVALGIEYISAFIAHLCIDGLKGETFMPVVTFVILLISYIYYHRLQKN